MKVLNYLLLLTMPVILLSCGAARKAQSAAAQKPVSTYVQPGYHLLGEKNVLRAWAVGISDSEMTAKKKAMASASAQLAQMLEQAVNTTVEDYCVSLTEGDVAKSKTYLNEKNRIVSSQVLTGAVVVFDQWEPKNEDGMYKNYVVLELVGSKYISKLVEEMNKGRQTGQTIDIDEKLLNELFLKAVNSGIQTK